MKKIIFYIAAMMLMFGFSTCFAFAEESALFEVLEPEMTDKEFIQAFNSTFARNGDKLRITSLKFAKSAGKANAYYCNFNYSTENKVGMIIFVRKSDSKVSDICVVMNKDDSEANQWGTVLGGFALQAYTSLPIYQIGQILGKALTIETPYGRGYTANINGHYYDILFRYSSSHIALNIARGSSDNDKISQAQTTEDDVSDWLLY